MQVNIPSVGLVAFPDSMSEEDVTQAIKTKILPQHIAASPQQPLPVLGLGGQIKQALTSPPSWVENYQPSSLGGAVAKATGETVLNPQTLSMALPVGTVWQGLSRLGELGSTAWKLGQLAKAGIATGLTAPMVEDVTSNLKQPKGELVNEFNQRAANIIVNSGMAGLGVLAPALEKPTSFKPVDVAVTPAQRLANLNFAGKEEWERAEAQRRAQGATFNAPPKGAATDLRSATPSQDVPQTATAPPTKTTSPVSPSQVATPASSATSNIGMLDRNFRHSVQNTMAVVNGYEQSKVFSADEASAMRGQIKLLALKANEGTDTMPAIKALQQQAADLGRYRYLSGRVVKLPDTQRQPLFAEIEQIKNRNGGMPPQPTTTGAQNASIVQTTQQPRVENAAGQSQGTEGAPRTTQGQTESQIPVNAGEGIGRAREGDKPRDEGLLGGRPVQGLNPTYPLSKSVHEGKLVDAQGRTVDPKTHKTTGESGFVLLPRDVIDKMGFAKNFKVQGEMLFNRLRNLLGADSGTWQALQGAGVGQFLKEKRTLEELQKWAEENSPKVEVRKFGASQQSPEAMEMNNIQHNVLDRLGLRYYSSSGTFEKAGVSFDISDKNDGIRPEDRVALRRYKELTQRGVGMQGDAQSHWQTIAPKSEQDMPGYVEIAVVKALKPNSEFKLGQDSPLKEDIVNQRGVQFPSSHNFPPNTLGFGRGYMETLPNGKKVFHIIEVQSDWAQARRAEEKETGEQAVQRRADANPDIGNDPLLPHYERLALKAAIDHARSEGADAIAISDAETAMMTEGHDRSITGDYMVREFPNEQAALDYMKNGPAEVTDTADIDGRFIRVDLDHIFEKDAMKHGFIRGSKESQIPQSSGMRLHYDQTLPKIIGELTGDKGEKVSFGEHKMAMDNFMNAAGVRGEPIVPRKDLIFRNPDGTPKTDVSARLYSIGKNNPTPEFSLFGKDKGEAGFVINVAPDILDAIKRGGNEIKALLNGEHTTGFINQLRGKDLPTTSAANKNVANKLYTYAQASAVSDVLSRTDPTEVLGARYNDPSFDTKLGKTLVEYNLRATGNTSVGKNWGFKNDAEYQAALKDPEVQAAIDRHAAILLKDAEQRHEALGGKKVVLDDPRMFVNLKFVPKEENLTNGSRGNLKATLQRKTRFGQERKGTADEYETSYRKLAERMIKANYNEFARKQLNDEYVKQGLGRYVKPGDEIPKDHVEIPLKLQRAIITHEGGAAPDVVNQNQSLYIRKSLASEYLQAMQANATLHGGALRKLADVMTRIQVSLGVDAIQHTVNMTSAVDGAVRASIGKNIVGVKELDTIKQLTKNAIDVVQNTPEFQKLISEMAKDYGIAREEGTYHGLIDSEKIPKFLKGSYWIRLVDQAGRVTLFQIAKDLANRGLIKNDPAEIRRFVNTQLGQYNPRLMSTFQALMKSTFSPFIVAGKTFNRLAASRLLLSSQVKAASPKACFEMRARQALYVTSALVIVPAVANYALTGNAFPPDTKLGQISLGGGKQFDMAKWTLMRRGLRITGAQALLEGQVAPRLKGEQPQALGQTLRQGAVDVARGVGSPYAGPLPNAVATLATGKTALGYEARQPGEQFPYGKAAVRQLNPLLGAGMTDLPAGQSYRKRAEQLVGVSETKESTVVSNLRRQFLYKIGKASDASFPPSDYDPLRQALLRGDKATAEQAYQALYQEKLKLHANDADPVRETQMDFQKYFERFAKAHGNASKEDEAAFVKTLTPHQQGLYDKVQQQQQAAADLFFSIQPKLNKKGKGIATFHW